MSFFYYLGNTIVIQKYVFYNLFTTIIRQSMNIIIKTTRDWEPREISCHSSIR